MSRTSSGSESVSRICRELFRISCKYRVSVGAAGRIGVSGRPYGNFWKPRRKLPSRWKPLQPGRRTRVGRRPSLRPGRGAVVPEASLDCEWDALVPRCIHARFGDGLGCPSSNREYRDRNCRLLRARGRLAALSRCRPHSLDEKLRTRGFWPGRGRHVAAAAQEPASREVSRPRHGCGQVSRADKLALGSVARHSRRTTRPGKRVVAEAVARLPPPLGASTHARSAAQCA
jgi:hypothetical protein